MPQNFQHELTPSPRNRVLADKLANSEPVVGRSVEKCLEELRHWVQVLKEVDRLPRPLPGIARVRRELAEFTANSILLEMQAAIDAKAQLKRIKEAA